MALGIGSLIRLAKSNIGADELAEVLDAMGIEASFTRVIPGDMKGEFEALWLTATEPRAGVMRLEMKMKNGERFAGLLVLSDPGNSLRKDR